MTDQRDDPSEIEEIEDNGEEGENKKEEALEKRYSDSSREAKRLAADNKRLAEERKVDAESIRVMKDASRLSTLEPSVADKVAKRLYDEGLYSTDDYHNALGLIKKPDTSRIDPDSIREQVRSDIARENEEKEVKKLLKDAGKTVQDEFEDEYGDLNLPPQKAKKIIEGIIAKNRKPIEDGKALASLASGTPRSSSPASSQKKDSKGIDYTSVEYWKSWGLTPKDAEKRAEKEKAKEKALSSKK